MMNLKIFPILVLVFSFSKAFSQCYELVWADEFNYTGAPDPAKWTHEVNGNGGGNNELQYYTNSLRNSRVVDSMLIIEAHKENYMGKAYTSARLITYQKAAFTYGKIEARIKLPYGQGIWPAFWMLGNDIFTGTGWPACGEIDIMEMVGGGEGRDDKAHGTIHWADANGNHAQYGCSRQLAQGIFNNEFHVFSIEWTDTYIKWFLDGEQYCVVSITPDHLSEFHQNFFLLLNLAIGGNWPGSPDASTVFPQQMWVDYVRVYQVGSAPAIEGPDAVVPQQKHVNFRLVDNPQYAYQWSAPEGAEIVAGQGTSSVWVNWGCREDTLRCTLSTPCETRQLTFPLQLKEVDIAGKNTVNTYEPNLVYRVTPAVNTTYTWILPPGVRSEKTDSSTIVLTWGDTEGTLQVEMESPCRTSVAAMHIEAREQLPYLGKPQSIPGNVLSVYYDTGGEGVAYHDTDTGNNGPGIRPNEDVDTEDGDGTGNIGWTFPDEWLEYSVEVEMDGYYDLECRTAGLTRGGSFRLLMNGRDLTGEKMASTANSWTNYRTMYIRNLALFATDTLLRLEVIHGDFNMANMKFTRVGTSLKPTAETNSPMLFPTVVSKHFTVNHIASVYRYQVISLTGVVVQNGSVQPGATLEVGHLKNGIYLLVLQNKGEIFSRKFIKTG